MRSYTLKSLSVRLMAVLALLFSASTLGQDISGNYRLDVQQDPGASDCVWSGALQMTQTGGNPGTFNGTGSANVFAPRDLIFAFARRGVGLEVMDTAAAARTFTVLANEGRKVAAVLYL